jgi:hypothetical protein
MSRLTLAGRQDGPSPRTGWVKSSLSFANGNCVEVASLPGGMVGVRDSKETTGPVLKFTPDEWHAFLGGVRNGEFDNFIKLSYMSSGWSWPSLPLAGDEMPSKRSLQCATGGTFCHYWQGLRSSWGLGSVT